MQIGKQIQTHRQDLGMTQDQLAEKLYVSRQTISNWENDRHYPDIENLLLLSVLFHTSLDDLVKGDVSAMKQKVFTARSTRDVKWMLGLLAAAIVSMGPTAFMGAPWWWLVPGLLWVAAMVPATHLEVLKHRADVRTYQEIIAYEKNGDIAALRARRSKWRNFWQLALIVAVFGAVVLVLALIVMVPFMIWGGR
ncbi:helix-turn-helix transcriptional regulator [Lacticaseibacillus parakribbianus]|uniref:helix-turn-helix transcriptional regulator n=1 Tax=Lacticaseibacillus parakribbianus TaxID=2970927 RepID=UPI0021CB7DDB|nr:helix-turn-helix transcriptional regulator [Lacticaseibacillus parakribbianus]